MTQEGPVRHGRIMVGAVIMAAGVLMLVERLDLADVHLSSRLWPLFPLGLGLLRLIDPPIGRDGRVRGRGSALWLTFIGCWGLANELHLRGLEYQNSWPLLVVFAGLLIVWRSFDAPATGRQEGQER